MSSIKKLFQPFNIFLFTIFTVSFVAIPGPISSLASLGVVGLLISFVAVSIRQRKLISQRSGYEWVFGLMIVGAVVALPDAYIPSQAWGAVANNLGIGLLFYLLFAFIQTKQDLDISLKVLLGGFTVILVAGVYQILAAKGYLPLLPFIGSIVTEGKGLHRISSLFLVRSGTSAYTSYLALAVPMAVSWLVSERKWSGWGFVLLFLMGFNVVFSLSRALFLALIFVAGCFALFSRYRWQLLSLGLVSLVVVLTFVAPLRRTALSIFDMSRISNLDHVESIYISVGSYLKHPFNGWGGGHVNWKFKKTASGWVNGRKLYRDADGQLVKKDAFLKYPYLKSVYSSIYLLNSRHAWDLLMPKYTDIQVAYRQIDQLAILPTQKQALKQLLQDSQYERQYAPVSLMQYDKEAWKNHQILYLRSPHNIYLYYAVEYGLLGITMVFLIFYLPFVKLWRVIRGGAQYAPLGRIFMSGLLGFAFYGLFHDSLQCSIVAAFYLIFMALVALLERLSYESPS